MSIELNLTRWLILALTVTLPSCDRSPKAANDYRPEYSFGYHNDTGAELTDVRSDWETKSATYHDEAGVLGTGGSGKASHEQPRPIPEKATVTWKTGDGKPHRKDVNVAGRVSNPGQFHGTIFYKFTADGDVKVVPLTYDEQRDRAVSGKVPVP